MIKLSFTDQLIGAVQTALASLSGTFPEAQRADPSAHLPPSEPAWSAAQKRDIVGCMRVNLSGEVAAQALYQGQALGASERHLKSRLLAAAEEEADHLLWCRARLKELSAQPSITDPAWYLIHFVMGFGVAHLGDGINLGFLVEIEHQVMAHLKRHLEQLPPDDQRSRAILQQMHADEANHAHQAQIAGAQALPPLAQKAMRLGSKLLTTTAYYL